MLTCEQVVDLLVDFLEGDVTPETRSALLMHLDHCPPCDDFLKQYRKTSDICREELKASVPSELQARVLAFLRSSSDGSPDCSS